MFDHSHCLDPSDWEAFRRESHRSLDAMLDSIADVRERPVWQATPTEILERLNSPMPVEPKPLRDCVDHFFDDILPHSIGNSHPGFMGWAHGGGNVVGMLSEMLSAGLNANLGGRSHAPVAVERQVVAWMSQLFGFGASASGLFVTGSSIANFIAILVARTSATGQSVRNRGVAHTGQLLAAYASRGTHGCIARAMDMAGLGSANLRLIDVDDQHRIDIKLLTEAITADRAAGKHPFCVVGNAGTVDVGAIDDLSLLAEVCEREKLWFHIDGACGGLGMMSRRLAPKLHGIERADSLALDFHKWAQVPYEAGFVLVRDGQQHQATFAQPAEYLARAESGMAAGSPWPCDFGPDLSRSFKAFKVWMTLQVYGTQRLAAMMERSCDVAQYLARRCEQSDELELLAPVSLNIVAFRYRCEDADRINSEIVVAIQESGVAAPSQTKVNGAVAIRAAIFNHRTTKREVDALLDVTLKFGRLFAQNTRETHASVPPSLDLLSTVDWPLQNHAQSV